MGSRGPLEGPWGPGVEPRRGSRGQRPRKPLGFSICERPKKAFLDFFPLNQPTSTWYRNVSTFLGGTAPNPKFGMFWALSQNCQLFWKMIWLSWCKLSEKVQIRHSNFSRPSVSWVIDWNMQNIFVGLNNQ